MSEPHSEESGGRAVSSIPPNLQVQILGMGEDSDELASRLLPLFQDFGRTLDLTSLDGVTFAVDYRAALRDLDRGYVPTQTLTPSDGRVTGVAMTPSVLRNGQLKSHIIIDFDVFAGMLKGGQGPRAVQLLAHECAHVEGNAQFDRAFPNVLLRKQVNYRDGLRSQIVLACWDEYVACLRSAPFGEDPRAEYEHMFLEQLRVAREEADTHITHYRLHSDISRIIREVSGTYTNLLKFAAYLLGNEVGHGRSWRDSNALRDQLDDHWFLPFLGRLEAALSTLAENRGKWEGYKDFEVIADIGEELIEYGGMRFYDSPTHPGEVGVELPYSPETLPPWDPRSSRSAELDESPGV